MSDFSFDTLRRDPDSAFADRLRERLRQQPDLRSRAPRRVLAKLAAGLAVAAGIGFAFTVPQVRASAESFLALFREVNFVAVPVASDAPLTRTDGIDIPRLIGERVQILEDGGPTPVLSPEAASAAAGFGVRMPAYLPDGTVRTDITVSGRHAARVTADTTRMRQVLDAVGIRDLDVPEALDGAVAVVRVSPMVMMNFELGTRTASLMQGPMPEILLPAGVDLARLAEMGLRLLGLPPAEAREFANAVDWRTTLVVPVPPMASHFRHVQIGSSRGIAIEGPLTDRDSGVLRGNWNLVLWSRQGQVYGIRSTMRLADVMQMANSIP